MVLSIVRNLFNVIAFILINSVSGGVDFVSVEPSGSPIVLSTEVPATSLRLVASDDNLCTGVKIYTISFSDSMSSSFYTAVAVEGRSNISISITDGMCEVEWPCIRTLAYTETNLGSKVVHALWAKEGE